MRIRRTAQWPLVCCPMFSGWHGHELPWALFDHLGYHGDPSKSKYFCALDVVVTVWNITSWEISEVKVVLYRQRTAERCTATMYSTFMHLCAICPVNWPENYNVLCIPVNQSIYGYRSFTILGFGGAFSINQLHSLLSILQPKRTVA